ncbi:MAG: GNAT family N-acetyltransferase [Clostridia bacterium]|nr:GNAT family N-acetyltransferase [Clostridia bacterium]
MADMLVKLYPLPEDSAIEASLAAQGIVIKQALAPDLSKVVAFTEECGHPGFADEVRVSFANMPVSCYIAVKDRKIVGFACYESTARGFFGPTAVLASERRKGIGKALLLKCLASLKDLGYAYAFIGWPAENALHFYENACRAVMIPDEGHGVYSRMIGIDE